MKRSLKFFSFWSLLALCTAAEVFNFCRKDNDSKRGSLTFASSPYHPGMFYQWNRKTGWPAINNITGWDATVPEGDSLEKTNDPSPTGWRIPTLAEIQKLCDTGNVTSEWINKNGLTGRKFTDKATGKSIFLPAVGYCDGVDGTILSIGSYGGYWSSAAYDSDSRLAYYLSFDDGNAGWGSSARHCGFNVRSVAD